MSREFAPTRSRARTRSHSVRLARTCGRPSLYGSSHAHARPHTQVQGFSARTLCRPETRSHRRGWATAHFPGRRLARLARSGGRPRTPQVGDSLDSLAKRWLSDAHSLTRGASMRGILYPQSCQTVGELVLQMLAAHSALHRFPPRPSVRVTSTVTVTTRRA